MCSFRFTPAPNILVSVDGIIKLSDFGASFDTASFSMQPMLGTLRAGRMSDLTHTTKQTCISALMASQVISLIGTPAYIAPEVVMYATGFALF